MAHEAKILGWRQRRPTTVAFVMLKRLLPLLCCAAPLAGQGVDCDGFLTRMAVAPGFCVRAFATQVGDVRHLVVHPSGVVVAATRSPPGLLRLEDTDQDGRADASVRFGPGEGGSGVAWRDGWLYFATDNAIYRYRWPAASRAPDTLSELVAEGLPESGNGYAHNAKGIAFGRDGALYVSVGSATDNCQVDEDIAQPGRFPCPDLLKRAGVWRLAPSPGATTWARVQVATGLRNAMAIGVDPGSGRVWGITHGRDFLGKLWSWSATESAMQPAELLVEIKPGTDFGWPYCMGYYQPAQTKLVPAPEYQGNTAAAADCSKKTAPSAGFPGHWAPMGLTFAPSTWPAEWSHGMVIAFHGSRSRAPLPEDGHYVVYLATDASGSPVGEPRILLRSLGAAGTLRPAGVAFTSTGMLYVSDDDHGIVYRIEPRMPNHP
ncbi:MAG: PQQ-dependent sugar dehydrogenase [Gemmatimonadota bacterium]